MGNGWRLTNVPHVWECYRTMFPPPKEKEGRVELMWGLCTVVHVDAAMWRNVHDVPCFGD